METQIYSYLHTKKGLKLITIFGYASRGVPGVEINAPSKFSKILKEKLIYLTRSKSLPLSAKKFVICIDNHDLDEQLSVEDFKWLEFPVLLLFWYLAGFVPIKKLDDCLSAGWISTRGEIYQTYIPKELKKVLSHKLNPVDLKSIKLITSDLNNDLDLWSIDSSMLLEHIEGVNFKFDYIDKDSATPINSFIA